MILRPVMIAPLILLFPSQSVDIASAQVPARVETPYTLMDAESRTLLEGGAETPLRGNAPLTGYGYLFFTRPHFLDQDLYLRLVIPPGYLISELILDHWPSQNSAIGIGVSGGLWAESQVEFRGGRFPPELFPNAALEFSLWHAVSYRDNAGCYGLPERPQESEHLTQRTWTRLGAIYTFWGTQASAFLNAGIAEDTDPLSAFRLDAGVRLRAEFPLRLHGYNVEEIFARRYWLLNASYRFPIWPGQDRVHLEVLGDYARVDYVRDHALPRSGLAGVGVSLSVALTKRFSLVVGYGYGIDAPRNGGFGGHEVDTQFEFKQ